MKQTVQYIILKYFCVNISFTTARTRELAVESKTLKP